jgi:hypothetical protein
MAFPTQLTRQRLRMRTGSLSWVTIRQLCVCGCSIGFKMFSG